MASRQLPSPNLASADKVAALHGMLTTEFAKRLSQGETIVTAKGEIVTISCSTGTLKEIRMFLLDNGVAAAEETNDGLSGLVERLPFGFHTVQDAEEAPSTIPVRRERRKGELAGTAWVAKAKLLRVLLDTFRAYGIAKVRKMRAVKPPRVTSAPYARIRPNR